MVGSKVGRGRGRKREKESMYEESCTPDETKMEEYHSNVAR